MNHLILGMGSMGKRHARLIRALRPDDKIITVDTNGEADYEYPNADLIPGSLVYICSPTRWHQIHLNWIVQNSPRGIFMEKPLFSRGEFRYSSTPYEINFPFIVAYQYRFHSLFRQLKQKHIHDNIFSYHIYASDSACKRYNDGAMETLLAHPIATAHWLFGDLREPLTADNQYLASFSAQTHTGVEVTMTGNFISGQRISLCIIGYANPETRAHEQHIFNVEPDEKMYETQMKEWLRYVEDGQLGELCGWNEALKVQEMLR